MRAWRFIGAFACGCTLSCGAAVATTDFTELRAADDRDPGVVTVIVGNETPVPISGAQVIIDGESRGIEPAERPMQVIVGPGEHELVLDLLLGRGGPAMFSSLQGYEARVRGQTRVIVNPGCRLMLRATAYPSDIVHVRPAIRFHHVMECAVSQPPAS